MLAKKSPLIFESFLVLESRYKFNQPEDDIQTPQTELFDSYGIDIDFAIQSESDESSSVLTFHVFTKMGVNQAKQPLAGYSIFVEGVGRYHLDKTTLSDKDIENLMSLSALSILINCLRGFLMDITAHAPMGRYILPSIDVNDLLRQKSAQSKRKVRSKRSIKG